MVLILMLLQSIHISTGSRGIASGSGRSITREINLLLVCLLSGFSLSNAVVLLRDQQCEAGL
jgi:hypothetical protein